MSQERYGMQNHAMEWSYSSGKIYADPFNDVELDVVFTDGEANTWRVPAFWAGSHEWRVRFAAPHAGTYRYRTRCSDEQNHDLHGQEGVLHVSPYKGNHELLRHGPLRVSPNHRYLEHLDGTPFFWLGDTWWMGLCRRLTWPDDFQRLTADRRAKGFTVIQIVAGLYPDMPGFDPRGANEAGYPWEKEYARIHPAYFDMADLRIQWLVKSGLVPCIVGCWGYYLPWLGIEKMKQHWRNLIARYGAYPVVWCLAGEGTMPYYLSKAKEKDRSSQKKGWTEIARYVRSVDPYHHPITIHPTRSGRDQVEDDTVLDLDMLQSGHSGYATLPNAAKHMRTSVKRSPRMPVVEGEVCYEGILEGSREEVQRFLFWTCMLSGLAGYTYGANGIWQVNTKEVPYGPSPHGASWGNTPWEDAYQLPGSRQIGLSKQWLEQYDWGRFEPHPEWVEPCADENEHMAPYAAGIPGEVRVFYFPRPIAPWSSPIVLKGLESDVRYTALFFNPKNGQEIPVGPVEAGSEGTWSVPTPPVMQDWVLVLKRADGS